VNRILAIAAVHEVLTERRDDDVDLADLIERLRATIVQGVGVGKTVETRLAEVSLAGALNVRTRTAHEFTEEEVALLVAIAAQVAHSIEHARLYAEAQARVGELEALARISEAVSESLYLEETLEEIVKTTIHAVKAAGASIVLDDGRVHWPVGVAAEHEERTPLRWKGRQLGELVCQRDTPFTDDELTLLGSIAHHAAVAVEQGRAVMRGVLAQEIHHRVKNNLQTVASLLRIQSRATDVDPRRALSDSVNRILAIAAVHEVLTERRDDDVQLAELIERLRATIVQGVGVGKTVETRLAEVSLAGDSATALALVFSELLQNALEHGGDAVLVELDQRETVIVLAVSDDGPGMGTDGRIGTGLSIVQALVRDELRGAIEFTNASGLRAEVTFPAA
jgi:two-component sensor histidine kinase